MSEDSDFFDALSSEDELGMVIRTHIHIESRLNEIFDAVLLDSSCIDKMKLEFNQKVKLALACGLHEKFEKPLNNLGTLRNNFAHKLGTKITNNEVNSLYACFEGGDKQIMQDAYRRTKMKLGYKGASSMSKLEPKERLKLILSSPHHIIRGAANEIKETN